MPMPHPQLCTRSNPLDYLELPTLAVLCIGKTETCPGGADRPVFCWASLDAGERLAQQVKAHGAQAECLGVKVLEAEGCPGPCLGILPGLQPDPFAQLVGRGLTRQAEAAAQLGARRMVMPEAPALTPCPGARVG